MESILGFSPEQTALLMTIYLALDGYGPACNVTGDAELTGETLELTVVQRIWGLIIEVINVIAEFLSCDPFELTENVINNNHKIKAVKVAFDRLDLAGAVA